MRVRYANAYILFYERTPIDIERFSEALDNPLIFTNPSTISDFFERSLLPPTGQINIQGNIHEAILMKNKKFWLSQFIFNKSFSELLLNVIRDLSIEEDSDY